MPRSVPVGRSYLRCVDLRKADAKLLSADQERERVAIRDPDDPAEVLWSLTSPREKVVRIGAKVVAHGRHLVFQMAEVAVPRELFRRILDRIAALRPPVVARC